jgi:hypothetical protein
MVSTRVDDDTLTIKWRKVTEPADILPDGDWQGAPPRRRSDESDGYRRLVVAVAFLTFSSASSSVRSLPSSFT